MMNACCILFAATLLGDGTCGVYSPDGEMIAFQRVVDGKSRVGVVKRGLGAFAWVDPDEGGSAHPAWSRSGEALAYAYGNETNTAWEAKGGDTGWHLRVWRRGCGIREITTGRFRDYMPSFSADGSAILFSSTRGASPDVFCATRSGVFSVDASGGEPKCLVASERNDMGVGQPVVSPDGKLLAYAQIDDFRQAWRIVCASMANPVRRCTVTPKGQVAYAPRWTPDGRHIVYTGFSKGDPGWCVYAINPRTGAARRICEGRNPDVHPTGALLLFDDGRRLYERSLGAQEMPGRDEKAIDEEELLCDEPERVVWRTDNPAYPARIPMDASFAFGADRTFFVRAKVRYSAADEPRFRHFVTGDYEGASLGFELFLDRGLPKFGVRDANGAYLGAIADGVLIDGREYVLTGIGTERSLFVHVEGRDVSEMRLFGRYPLERPLDMEIGPTLGGSGDILSCEVGTGWPANVPRPLTRTRFFSEEGEK